VHVGLVVQQLAAQRLVEALDRVLGPAVRGLQGDATVGQRGPHLHDGPGVAGGHPLQGGHGGVDEAEVVDLGDPLVLLRSDLLERGEHGGERHVHPHVDGAELVLDALGCGLDLAGVGDVGGHHQGPAATGLDVARRSGQAGLTAGEQRNRGAAGAERGGGGPADAPTGSGDDDDLSVRGCTHRCLLLRRWDREGLLRWGHEADGGVGTRAPVRCRRRWRSTAGPRATPPCPCPRGRCRGRARSRRPT